MNPGRSTYNAYNPFLTIMSYLPTRDLIRHREMDTRRLERFNVEHSIRCVFLHVHIFGQVRVFVFRLDRQNRILPYQVWVRLSQHYLWITPADIQAATLVEITHHPPLVLVGFLNINNGLTAGSYRLQYLEKNAAHLCCRSPQLYVKMVPSLI